MKNCVTTTLRISGLSEIEKYSYFEKFGRSGFLEVEGKILLDLKEFNEFGISELNTFFNISAENFDYLVIELP